MVEHLLDQSRIDVMVVTETWLNKEIDRHALMIENYNCDIRVDRANKRGGGIIIYSKNGIDINEIAELRHTYSESSTIEQLWVKISIGRCKPIILGACYRPPKSPVSHLAALENSLLEVISTNQEILLVGDFNCNFLKPQESPNKELIEMISSYHLIQVITEPTRVTAETQTLIDLIIKTPTLNTIK